MREAGREPGQIEEIEAEKGEIAHVRGCVLRDGIEPALALDVTEVVLAIIVLAELITTIHEKEIGIETAPETVKGTKDLPHDDEAEKGLGMIVTRKNHEKRNPTKPLRRNARRNARRKRRNHLTAEVLLEPQPLLRDLALVRLRMSVKSGSRKRSRSGRRRPRHIRR